MAATLALYNLDGTLDHSSGQPSSSTRRRAHLTLTALSAVWLLTELFSVGSLAVLPIFAGFSLCATYALRLIIGGRTVQIKSIPGVKAPFIGSSVGCAAVLVPVLLQPSALDPLSRAWRALLLALCLGAFCTANALLFDIPDMPKDRQFGVQTMALRYGPARAKQLAIACIGAGSVYLFFASPEARLALGALAIALLLSVLLVQPSTPKSSVAFWVDGALALPLILLAFSR